MEANLFGGRATYQGRPLNRPAPVQERLWRPIEPDTILLCIDPSITACGWAILKNTRPDPTRLDSGVFHPVSRDDINRYDHLAKLMRQRIHAAREQGIGPTEAIIEVPAGGQWGRSATQLMAYSRAIGVCEATCYGLKIQAHRATVTEWKGHGKKERTALIVRHVFKYDPRDSNEADALGLGLWLCSQTGRQ